MREPLKTYRALCTEFYERESHLNHQEALDFYLNYARHAKGLILEPMCGTGRFLIPIGQAGFAIEGFDASEQMLEVLKQKEPSAHVWQEFMQDFNRDDKRYSLIFVPYGSWGLMDNIEDSKKSLKIMYDHVVPGGKFVVEIETVASASKTVNMWHRAVQTRNDGSYIALNTYPTYSPETQIFTAICRYESIVKNQIKTTETEDFKMYLYHYDEFERYLHDAGFSDIKKYQDYNKTVAFDNKAPLLIYECSKKRL